MDLNVWDLAEPKNVQPFQAYLDKGMGLDHGGVCHITLGYCDRVGGSPRLMYYFINDGSLPGKTLNFLLIFCPSH